MSWGEALRLTQTLLVDCSSFVGAAVAGWRYPATREALVLMDSYDLAHRKAAKKKPKPYPRPWDPAPKRFGTGAYTPDELRAVLNAHRGATALHRDPSGRLRDSQGRFARLPASTISN